MTIAEMISGLANKLTSTLSSINTALVNKGQTAASSMTEIPAKIEAIKTGIDTATTNGATSGDILLNKEAFVNGEKVIGSIATKSNSNLSPSGATITGPAGYYADGISKSISNGALNDTMAFNVDNSTGIVTATASVETSGYLASGKSTSDTKQLTTNSGGTWTPSATTARNIAKGTFLTGALSLAKEPNLIASNIKSDVSIFGVTGTYSGSGAKVFSQIMQAEAYSDVFEFNITPTFSINTTTEQLLLLVIQKTGGTAEQEIKMFTYDKNHDQFSIWFETENGEYGWDYYTMSEFNDENAYVVVSDNNGIPTVQVGICVYPSTGSNYAGFVSGKNNQDDYYVTAIFG